MATLLRLADTALHDAGLLFDAGSDRNAALVLDHAGRWLIAAAGVSEQGWPSPASGIAAVPNGNPLKPRLMGLVHDRAMDVAPDGKPGSSPFEVQAGIDSAAALLAEMARTFAVDLASDAPAGNADPIRPPPALKAAPKLRPLAKPQAKAVPEAKPLPELSRLPWRPTAAKPLAPLPAAVPSPAPSPAAPPSNGSSVLFWSLMDRWAVTDTDALTLLGHPGGLTKKGTRPRFKLTAAEMAVLHVLQEIDSTLRSLQIHPAQWLTTAPPGGPAPLATLTAQPGDGARALLRGVVQQGLRSSIGN